MTECACAVVTGASSGIGEAFALLLADKGYRPVLIAHKLAELERVAGTISSRCNVEPIVVCKNLGTPGAADELSSELASRGLFPDLLINNAGFGLMGRADALDLEEQLEMIRLNVGTLTELSLRYGRLMRERGQGGIINVSSVAGTLPGPNMATYYATKAYITSFTEALSFELEPFGVQVTAVLPGVTSTCFHDRAGMKDSLLMRCGVPMSPEKVARIGYDAFCSGRRVVVTGIANKLATYCTRLIPHFVLLPVIAKLHSRPKASSPQMSSGTPAVRNGAARSEGRPPGS